ncbi:MAG: GNAT family N-acetyltransferase [Cyclobacteriaceae bacterium]|nr:GNAT family N-acetyltransferase [Cyclobacteriaceae bacterium]
MPPFEIREVRSSELKELHQFARDSFVDTYASQNTPENMHLYLKEEFSEEKIFKLLNDPNVKFFFALNGGEIIGYLQINWGKAQSENLDSSIEIARIYVRKDFQGRKTGSLLLKKAIQFGKDLGVQWLWLGVWEKNTKAMDFYRKNGFQIFDQHLFKLGSDEQLDWMMRINLNLHA